MKLPYVRYDEEPGLYPAVMGQPLAELLCEFFDLGFDCAYKLVVYWCSATAWMFACFGYLNMSCHYFFFFCQSLSGGGESIDVDFEIDFNSGM